MLFCHLTNTIVLPFYRCFTPMLYFDVEIHPVSVTRFPSFRTQTLENLSRYLWNKWVPEQPRPWRKSCDGESCDGDRVLVILIHGTSMYWYYYYMITVLLSTLLDAPRVHDYDSICVYVYNYVFIYLFIYMSVSANLRDSLEDIIFAILSEFFAILSRKQSPQFSTFPRISAIFANSAQTTTPGPPTKSFPIKSPRVKLSGRLPIRFYGHENSHPLELRVCLSQSLWNPNS